MCLYVCVCVCVCDIKLECQKKPHVSHAECAVCLYVCVCVCDIKLECQKKPHYVSDLSNLDALLHKIHIKVLLVLR